MSAWCDRLVKGGIFFLILFTPFAFGSVHPWAYSIMEAVVFLLVAVWMLKVAVLATEQRAKGEGQRAEFGPQRSERFAPGALPLALFLIFILFQLLPLPPSLLRVLSPQTFAYYIHSLPGWPEKVPYAEIGQKLEVGDQRSEVNGQRLEVRNLISDRGPLISGNWLPLSLAPALTRTDLLKFTAYAALFFLVLLYPFSQPLSKFEIGNSKLNDLPSAIRYSPSAISPSPFSLRDQPSAVSNSRTDERFFRTVLLVILFAGLVVAALGFVQRFSWNGKILWFFVPYDWAQAAHSGVPRASGPFVNADHFANYLALIFPLSVACALFRKFVVSKRLEIALLIFCVLSAFLLFTGILLSLSRSGWISALLGLIILLCLQPRRVEQGTPSFFRTHGFALARLSLIILCALLVGSLFFVGPGGREQVDERLGQTINQDSGLWGRTAKWKDSLGMVRDFPLFGVGLGAWPEVFLRYRRPPWTPDFYREAHNDYLELLTETGVFGFGLLAWFFWRGGKLLVGSLKRASPNRLPLMAAILAALGVMAFHEWFDFSLQIPANAFLFTLLFALALRMAKSREQGAVGATGRSPGKVQSAKSKEPGAGHREHGAGAGATEVGRTVVISKFEFRNAKFPLAPHALPLTPLLVAVIAVVLVVCAFSQEQIPYPYNLKEPKSVAQAKELLLSQRTQASLHLGFLRLMGNKAPLSEQLSESRAALWIEPTNPFIRDFYAATLLRAGKKDEGLREITRSTADSPSLETHFYLSGELAPRLSKAEQAAIEAGFKQALALGYGGALDGFAGYYGTLRRFSDQGALYEQAALGENDGAKRAGLLHNAGLAYVKAQDEAKAEFVLRKAVADFPSDPKAYQQLATAIYGPKEDFQKAEEIVLEGIKNGAPPVYLYLSLAEAAQKASSLSQSKRALSLAKTAVEKAANKGDDAYPFYLVLADGARKVGDREQEIAALLEAFVLRPGASDILFRVAVLYLEQRNFDRAALYFSKLANINPDSAEIHYSLAVAEEQRYHFAAADQAYARAVELAPDNRDYRRRYKSFRTRLEQNKTIPAPDGKAQRAKREG